jgi:hypothetical protein
MVGEEAMAVRARYDWWLGAWSGHSLSRVEDAPGTRCIGRLGQWEGVAWGGSRGSPSMENLVGVQLVGTRSAWLRGNLCGGMCAGHRLGEMAG